MGLHKWELRLKYLSALHAGHNTLTHLSKSSSPTLRFVSNVPGIIIALNFWLFQVLYKAVLGPTRETFWGYLRLRRPHLGLDGAWGWRRTAHLGAELLVVALGALVQPLCVMQQLLDLPHLPLAAPQLAFQLFHLPPQLGQLRLGGGRWRRRQRRRRRLRGHGVRREAARGSGGTALKLRRTPSDPEATGARGQRKAASSPPGCGGPRPWGPKAGYL